MRTGEGTAGTAVAIPADAAKANIAVARWYRTGSAYCFLPIQTPDMAP